MVKLYIPPPDVSEVTHQLARWIALFFRVKVSITVDDLNGTSHTVNVEKP